MLGANPREKAQTRDLDAARQHLADCKYSPDDFVLELSWIGEVPLEERFALLMQANYAEIGIESKIMRIPWALFAEQVSNSETTPNVSQVFVTAVTGDPDTLLYGMYHSSAAGTWQSPEHLNDAEVDRLLDAGAHGDDAGGPRGSLFGAQRQADGDFAHHLRPRPALGLRGVQPGQGAGAERSGHGLRSGRIRL